MKIIKLLFIIIFCSVCIDLYSIPTFQPNSTVLVSENYDLQGNELKLPTGVTLNFSGGAFINGSIVGCDTKIIGKNYHIFDNVEIKGSWNVPLISSNMFTSFSKDNSLRNVIALTNKKINNKVIIEPGFYNFKFDKNEDTGLLIEDNTSLILNGTLTITPNRFTNYQIIRVCGKNIHIKGSGSIVGDKNRHTGLKGEWGMGIEIYESYNVSICNLKISNCWGDCIYVGHMSKKILIKNCELYESRRQGISITDGADIVITNCWIHNIFGTLPGFGIDVEPNKNCKVENVVINNVTIYECNGGIELNGHADNSYVNNVKVRNCTLYNIQEKYLVQCYDCNKISFENCTIDRNPKYVLFKDCQNAYIKNTKNHY